MKKALLFVLAGLLLPAARPGPGRALERLPPSGEWCRVWKYTAVATGLLPSTVRSFRCPQPFDSADAAFCCGSCGAPYCCASRAARLDPDGCADAGKAATPPSRSSEQVLLGFVWFCFSVVIFSILCCVAHTIYYYFGDCQKTSREELQPVPMGNLHARTQVNRDLNSNDPSFPNNATLADLRHYPMRWNLSLP